jgi:hypothetical protein
MIKTTLQHFKSMFAETTKYSMIVTYNIKQDIKVYVHYHFGSISEIKNKNLRELCKLNRRKKDKQDRLSLKSLALPWKSRYECT